MFAVPETQSQRALSINVKTRRDRTYLSTPPSRCAKDTDFTVKLIDVYPDGRAFNLDETIQRMRYRAGYDKPNAWMEAGKVYRVALQPMTTSNYFEAGHRIRIEISSSNFPR